MNNIEKILEPEFGGMTSRKAVTALGMPLPQWRTDLAIRNHLKSVAKGAETIKRMTKRRQRDIDRDKFKEIVDGRTN